MTVASATSRTMSVLLSMSPVPAPAPRLAQPAQAQRKQVQSASNLGRGLRPPGTPYAVARALRIGSGRPELRRRGGDLARSARGAGGDAVVCSHRRPSLDLRGISDTDGEVRVSRP